MADELQGCGTEIEGLTIPDEIEGLVEVCHWQKDPSYTAVLMPQEPLTRSLLFSSTTTVEEMNVVLEAVNALYKGGRLKIL